MNARLDLTPAEKLAHDRRLAAARKRRERARRGSDAINKQSKREAAACVDWALLNPHIRKEHETGCWVWRGPYAPGRVVPRPIVRRGQYGVLWADIAVYLAYTGRRAIPRGAYLKRTCEKISCVSPHCVIATNHIVEATKAELKRSHHGKQGSKQGPADQRVKQGAKQQAARQLSRVG